MRWVCLMGIFLLAFSQNAMTQEASDETWAFGQLRKWADHHPWDGDTASGVRGHKEIRPTDPLFKTLSSQFSWKSGLVAEVMPPAVPYGKLVWWDIEGQGTKYIVFAGGASPDPYCVIFKRIGNQWHVWQECKGRLLSIFGQEKDVVLVLALDGYGIERENGMVLRVCPPGERRDFSEVIFRWVGDLHGLAAHGKATTCTTLRPTALRTSPQQIDVPEESGMGFDWPGNLYQRFAQGAAGWQLETTRNAQGELWSMVVFSAPPPTLNETLLKAMHSPLQVKRPVLTQRIVKTTFIVGWVKSEDVNEE